MTYTKDDSNLKVAFSGSGRSNEFQGNNMTSTKPTQLQPNQLQGTPIKATAVNEENQQEAVPLTEQEITQFLLNATDEQIIEFFKEAPAETRTIARKILNEMKPGDSLD